MQFGQLKRREFISLLGGAATAWPLGVRAQQPERMRRVGILMPLTAEDAYDQARLAAFLQGLQQDGWSVGQNLRIDTRWGGGDVDRIHRLAGELVALQPDVILGIGTNTAVALQRASRSVPVVFTGVSDRSAAAWSIASRTQAAI
jgi:putative tryptophan/tyrosine transport system substrate-binding protein